MSQPTQTGADEQQRTVETQFFTFGSDDAPFFLRSGATLPSVTLAYETWGSLNAEKDNAILLFHALSGSQHAAGRNPSVPGFEHLWTSECQIGWWDSFVGPGKALDTDRFFVICVNYLGGCYGSTGPASLDPGTGKPYGGAFPRISVADIVDSQMHLLDHLGIRELHGAVGGSIGGMMCLSLATRYPDRVRILAPIATGLEVTSLQRIINFEQIFTLEQDPNYRGGDYYDGPRPDSGVCAARMISHKTFVSLHMLENRATKEIISHNDEMEFYRLTHAIESYMLHQGRKFTKRFDANTYLRVLDSWQTFDLIGDSGKDGYEDIFDACTHQRYMVFSIDSDVCFYPEEQQILTRTLQRAGVPHRRITIHSDKGHDAFLLETELLTPHLKDVFEQDWNKV